MPTRLLALPALQAFLFTLPVAVDFSALDRRMLERYWGDR